MTKFFLGWLLGFLLSATAHAQSAETFKVEPVSASLRGIKYSLTKRSRIEFLVVNPSRQESQYRIDTSPYRLFHSKELCGERQQWTMLTPLSECQSLIKEVGLSIRFVYGF